MGLLCIPLATLVNAILCLAVSRDNRVEKAKVVTDDAVHNKVDVLGSTSGAGQAQLRRWFGALLAHFCRLRSTALSSDAAVTSKLRWL